MKNERLIGRIAYWPIVQTLWVGNKRKKMTTAYIEVKIVSVKKHNFRTDIIVQPKAGAGLFTTQLDAVRFELEEVFK